MNWLTEVLVPVAQKFGQHQVKDSFEFCEHIDKFMELHQDCSSVYMCSFDVVSLFTNVPLHEVIQICLNTLFRDEGVVAPPLPEEFLKKLLYKATSEVEFSFDGQLYRQTDGVAMGSPLGPVFANIFMGYLESSIPKDEFPLLYDRFVDDTFAIFSDTTSVDTFFRKLNSLHPNVRFTMEREMDGALPFLDVGVARVNGGLQRSVHRKPTFTGFYTRWDSFCPTRH